MSGQIELHLLEVRDGLTLCHIGEQGYWFGEMAALSGAERRIDVLARGACKLVRLTRADLHRLLDAHPSAWSYVALLVNSNLYLALRLIEALKQQEPTLRIAHCLRNMVAAGSELPTRINVTQADIAAIAGVSRKTANSALRVLHAKQFIDFGYGWIDVRVAPSRFTGSMSDGP